MTRIIIAALLATSCTSDDSSTTQSVGSTASGYQSEAVDDGDTYEGVTCDDSTQGMAWCDDDFNVVYCSGGVWRDFDCAYLGQYCLSDGDDVDCYDL